MFLKAVPDNRNGKEGCYCSLVESKWENGKSAHVVKANLGFISSERLPYLRAAFAKGDPEAVLLKEKSKLRKD